MSCRVISTFIRTCADCPNCVYYSGGTYICTLTDERIFSDDKQSKVGDNCPLPYAGPPVAPVAAPVG